MTSHPMTPAAVPQGPAATGGAAFLPPAPAGAVYDRGYRPYAGHRGDRRSSALAVWRLTVRRALGLRRSWRQKVLPWSLLAIATVPAVVEVGVAYALRDDPLEFADFNFTTYREYVGVSTALLVFVALSAPDAICPDRRQRVLPLLFSRPLTGPDYVAAKLGAIWAIVFGFGFGPQVVLFLGQMLVSKDGALDYLTANAEVLWQVPVAVALLAAYYSALGVALASLTDRRIVGGVAIFGATLVPSAVAGVFTAASGSGNSALSVLDVLSLPLGVRDLVFLGHVTDETGMGGVEGGGLLTVTGYLVVLLASVAVALHRYRRVDL